MVYVALLRGINVGGNNKIAMALLKTAFERLGFYDVKTYINSGNIIFRADDQTELELAAAIERVIKQDFGLDIKVLVRNRETIQTIARTLSPCWVNDQTMKCDVMFLWEDVDNPRVVEQLAIKPDLEDAIYVKGALLWRVTRKYITRSGMMKMVGTELYKKITVRNCNTLRKIAAIMNAYE